jgi:hypothetical protein
MPQIKPGHRLYLYRLFARELGVGKQTALDRAADVLAADGLAPADLGFEDARSMFEALDECIKLTVFKKNAVFVTVIANEAYDQALVRASKSDGDKPAKGKPWKQKRGGKNIKPVRPKHIEPEPEPAPEPQPVAEPEPAAAAEPETAPAAIAEPQPATEPEATNEPQPSTADEPQPAPEAVAEPAPTNTPADEPQPATIPVTSGLEPLTPAASGADSAASDVPSTGSDSAPLSSGEAGDASLDATREASEERSDERGAIGRGVAGLAGAPTAPEPSIHLTITYAPEPEPEEEEFEPEPTTITTLPPREIKPARPVNDLPQDFYSDVCVTDEPLSALYQVLPLDVDPVATLEEDFRIARSTGALTGTRSEVSFPLRFQRKDGSPVMVTLRRRARSIAGKRWVLSSIDADSPEEVGMGSLEHKAPGPWAAFANEEQLKDAVSPEAELAQFAVLGSWDKLLKQLAELAEPEDWGEDHVILREYLAMTFRRVARQGRLSMADDGSSAAFDTGLVTAGGETIAAILEPHDGDIQWELTCFSTNAKARPATYLPEFNQPKAHVDHSGTADDLHAAAAEITGSLRRVMQQAVRNPRFATLAYDAVNDRVVGLLPVNGKVCAVIADENGKPQVIATPDAKDAYICARVVSCEQPSWLVKAAR